MKKEKIAITTAGRNLASELIIHLDVEDSSSDLKSKIKLVIEKLEEFDQHSVAFPANGGFIDNIALSYMYNWTNTTILKGLDTSNSIQQ